MVACEATVARRWKVVQCEQAEELCKKRLDAAKVNKQTVGSKSLESFWVVGSAQAQHGTKT